MGGGYNGINCPMPGTWALRVPVQGSPGGEGQEQHPGPVHLPRKPLIIPWQVSCVPGSILIPRPSSLTSPGKVLHIYHFLRSKQQAGRRRGPSLQAVMTTFPLLWAGSAKPQGWQMLPGAQGARITAWQAQQDVLGLHWPCCARAGSCKHSGHPCAVLPGQFWEDRQL